MQYKRFFDNPNRWLNTHIMGFDEFSSEQQKASIHAFAEEALSSYELEVKSIECVNFEFNASFQVCTESSGTFAMRVNINSKRTQANLAAEIDFVRFLRESSAIKVPNPQPMKNGSFFGSAHHSDSGRNLNFVLYSWLPGKEIGHSPTDEQAFALGTLMAEMHEATRSFSLGRGSELAVLRDPLWEQSNNLFGASSRLGQREQEHFSAAIQRIDHFLEEIYSAGTPQPIHADLHGGNVLEDLGKLSVIDFDDCAIGFPLQDIATTLYYFDNERQDRAFLDGYASIRNLPIYTDDQMSLLLLQRRLVLLNYLLETTTPEHREMLPKYLEESLRRVTTIIN